MAAYFDYNMEHCLSFLASHYYHFIYRRCHGLHAYFAACHYFRYYLLSLSSFRYVFMFMFRR